MGNTDVWAAKKTEVLTGDCTAKERGRRTSPPRPEPVSTPAAMKSVNLNVSPAHRHSPGTRASVRPGRQESLPFICLVIENRCAGHHPCARPPRLHRPPGHKERHASRADTWLSWASAGQAHTHFHPTRVTQESSSTAATSNSGEPGHALPCVQQEFFSWGRRGGNFVDICLPVGPPTPALGWASACPHSGPCTLSPFSCPLALPLRGFEQSLPLSVAISKLF